MKEYTDLDKLRHSCAHVMAQAVKDLWPETKGAIGPPIENGFYYDFDKPEPFTNKDLKSIEKQMRKIAIIKQARNLLIFVRGLMSTTLLIYILLSFFLLLARIGGETNLVPCFNVFMEHVFLLTKN